MLFWFVVINVILYYVISMLCGFFVAYFLLELIKSKKKDDR